MDGTIIEFDGEHYHLDEMTTDEIEKLIEKYKEFEEFKGEIILARRYLLKRLLKERKGKK